MRWPASLRDCERDAASMTMDRGSLFRLTGGDQGQACLVDPAPAAPVVYTVDLRVPNGAATDILGAGWAGKPGPAGVAASGAESTLLLPVPGGDGDMTVTPTLSASDGAPRTLSITLDGKQLGQTVTVGSQGSGGDGAALPIPLPRSSVGNGPFFRLGLVGAAPPGQKPTSLLAVKVETAAAR